MKVCEDCGVPIERGYYCQRCYNYRVNHPEGIYPIPEDGVMTYATNGDAICHECGRAYRKLGNHIAFYHHMSIAEYKDKHKLYHSTKLSNKDYSKTMSDYVTRDYEVVVKENLIHGGVNTRYQKGQVVEGRGKHIKGER